jgi:hypothetical protein
VKRVALAALCLFVGLAAFLASEGEFQRVDSPDGSFTAVITARRVWSFVPGMPGSASDRPGTVRVERRDGRSCGSAPLEMVQQGYDLRWEDQAANLPAVAQWDLRACSVEVFAR